MPRSTAALMRQSSPAESLLLLRDQDLASCNQAPWPRLQDCSLPVCVSALLPSFAKLSGRICSSPMQIRSVMLPRHRPVFIGPSRPDDQLPVYTELVNARKILADKEFARIRSLHVMRQHMLRFIQVVAPE